MARSPARRSNDGRDRHDGDRSYRRRSPSRDVRSTYRPRSENYLNNQQRRYDDRRDDRRDRSNYDEQPNGRGLNRRNSRPRDNRPRYDDHPRRPTTPINEPRRDGGRREASSVRDNGRYNNRRSRSRHDNGYGNHDSNKRPRLGSNSQSRETSRPTTADSETYAADDADVAAKKRVLLERQAKIEAWKSKKATEAAAAPAFPPATSNTPAVAHSPALPTDENAPASPPRRKFDPKAIKKRTDAAMAKAKADKPTLGKDVAIPSTINGLTNGNRTTFPAASGSVAPPISVGDAKITGFGLNKTWCDKTLEKSTAGKTTTALDEDEGVARTFKKLPDLPQDSDMGDTALAHDQDEQDEGEDQLHSDEEDAEATREAAQRRAEEVQTEQDAKMADAAEPATAPLPETNGNGSMDVDEEVDPLDEFMTNLDQSLETPQPARPAGQRTNRGTQLFDDDDDGPAMEAVGDDPENLLNNPQRKKKEVPKVDHAKVQYEPLRKDFYHESIEIAEMSEEDVTKLRYELDEIVVRGLDQPKPITKWSQCGFNAQILDVIREHKFDSPTSIQCQALPAIMSGRDTIGIAKTGSGKTLAFILPMFRHIKDQRPVANLEGPIGLIMVPTRELAIQIHRECKPYLKALNLRGMCAYGGAPIKDQIAELKRGVEIVVCTPGRLIDLLASNAGRVTNLSRTSYVVLDEADRMFDMGFEPQIQKILGNIRPDRQTVLFSATFPKKMDGLARKALIKPVEIQVGGRSIVAKEITQIIEVLSEDAKMNRVLQLLGQYHERDQEARILIFVERQETADNIFKVLGQRGYAAVPVHGGREQIDRDQAIIDFKAGILRIMVATSVAARGLDVKQLMLVINYDSPNHSEDYVHRAGRTGRAGNTGTAVTFVTPEQECFAPFLVRALQDSQQEVPETLKDMAASHKRKVQSGEASWAGSGFGGKGIEKLDAARAAERAWEKRQFKTGDEPEEEDENATKKKEKELELSRLVAKASGAVKDRDAAPEQPAQAADPVIGDHLQQHLDNAQKVQKAVTPSPALRANDPVARAAAAAANISSRIGAKGATRPGAPTSNRGPDAGAFHATLEINDFPQKARWAVTNRSNVAKVLDSTGTSITSKGAYHPPGKELTEEDEPKLYILVEGDTEIAVQSAMRELSDHLREGMRQAQELESRSGTIGRYKVV